MARPSPSVLTSTLVSWERPTPPSSPPAGTYYSGFMVGVLGAGWRGAGSHRRASASSWPSCSSAPSPAEEWAPAEPSFIKDLDSSNHITDRRVKRETRRQICLALLVRSGLGRTRKSVTQEITPLGEVACLRTCVDCEQRLRNRSGILRPTISLTKQRRGSWGLSQTPPSVPSGCSLVCLLLSFCLHEVQCFHTPAMALPVAVWTLCVGSLVLPPCSAFFPNFWARILTLAWSSYTHQDITEEAILNVTREIFMSQPNRWGHILPVQEPQEPLTAGDLFGSYYGDQEAVSMKAFWQAVGEVVRANAHMDFRSEMQSNPIYHFDSERIQGARDFLRWRWIQTLDSITARDYQGAREGLGYLLHSLQDFYSHSNWVEMGHTEVNSDLLNSADQLVAAEDVQTCRECWDFSCKNNILEDVNSRKLLTTGYFGTDPKKPPGKCSHGGILDQSRSLRARGGINKDSTSPLFSPHHYLHGDAARLATAATVTLLRDLRDTAGVTDFLRLMNVGQNSALVFVIDTTGSMFEEITAARLRALSIIQERQGTLDEPTTYVLVPFHDPAVGPLQETEDPDVFMRFLEDLTALGGGDEPEMCLTALQMALIHSPPQSEIYVFTDASPKDRHLQSAVEGLTVEKRIKVTFLLTGPYSVSPHSFHVDSSVKNVTLHIAGSLKAFVLHSPSGQEQSLLEKNGHLAQMEMFDGLTRIRLLPPVSPGQWIIRAETQENITLNVIGQSSVDFLYHFAVAVNSTHPGLSRVEGSPVAGVPTFLVLTVTGLSANHKVSFSHVTLLSASGESLLGAQLTSSSSSPGEFVSQLPALPTVPFSVRLTGTDGQGNVLERASGEMVQATHVQLQVRRP
ncbi:VWA7 protein, partial [Atractosteus spatula]|nr:VWA7 protein [Atractosteus spatula]